VETACRLEATAPKPGNVHPGAAFPDLSHAELVAAGRAIAEPLDRAATRPIGVTILEAVTRSRQVTRSNANLGIVLAIAPLAAVPDRVPLHRGVADVLARTNPDDARDAWRAIAIASPGGLGRASRHDLAGPPPENLLEAMRAAADRDGIAHLWATGFRDLFERVVPDLETQIGRHGIDEGIVRAHVRLLADRPDTLIARRHGETIAREVSESAATVVAGDAAAWHASVAAFDAWLRRPPRRNPGTTADFLAAALFILLREERLHVDA
jgi:triphosphoribosyl-dephospho-CoA synthase